LHALFRKYLRTIAPSPWNSEGLFTTRNNAQFSFLEFNRRRMVRYILALLLVKSTVMWNSDIGQSALSLGTGSHMLKSDGTFLYYKATREYTNIHVPSCQVPLTGFLGHCNKPSDSRIAKILSIFQLIWISL
jgi:hypothetical protein